VRCGHGEHSTVGDPTMIEPIRLGRVPGGEWEECHPQLHPVLWLMEDLWRCETCGAEGDDFFDARVHSMARTMVR